MIYTYHISFISLTLITLSSFISTATAGNRATSVRAISETKYSIAHSLGDNYSFDPRDGWQNVNVTDLPYKYRRDPEIDVDRVNPNDNTTVTMFDKRNDKKKAPAHNFKQLGLGATIKGVVHNVLEGLKGIGSSQTVTITWYTGNDLKNPSCWANGKWAPTDGSFACALTLEGWKNRPQCFKFLELCNTPKKCVFVRVVDTCAGCAAGSRHVDLTRAAFGQLADFDQGILSVQLRASTEPTGWFEDLWGPKVEN